MGGLASSIQSADETRTRFMSAADLTLQCEMLRRGTSVESATPKRPVMKVKERSKTVIPYDCALRFHRFTQYANTFPHGVGQIIHQLIFD